MSTTPIQQTLPELEISHLINERITTRANTWEAAFEINHKIFAENVATGIAKHVLEELANRLKDPYKKAITPKNKLVFCLSLDITRGAHAKELIRFVQNSPELPPFNEWMKKFTPVEKQSNHPCFYPDDETIKGAEKEYFRKLMAIVGRLAKTNLDELFDAYKLKPQHQDLQYRVQWVRQADQTFSNPSDFIDNCLKIELWVNSETSLQPFSTQNSIIKTRTIGLVFILLLSLLIPGFKFARKYSMTRTTDDLSLTGVLSEKETVSVYFAGALFKAHDLTGNSHIGAAVENLSEGYFKMLLPQSFEPRSFAPKVIRDEDIKNVLKADAVVVQFDGTEVDSGTTVEYMIAKMADIPVVILRSDIRNGGDQGDGDPWNIMLSFFPRVVVKLVDSLSVYKEALKKAKGNESQITQTHELAACKELTNRVAKEVIDGLKKVLIQAPLMDRSSQETIYTWLGNLPNLAPEDKVFIQQALKNKQLNGLL